MRQVVRERCCTLGGWRLLRNQAEVVEPVVKDWVVPVHVCCCMMGGWLLLRRLAEVVVLVHAGQLSVVEVAGAAPWQEVPAQQSPHSKVHLQV